MYAEQHTQGKAPSAGSAASSCNSESAPLLRERRTVSRAEAAGGEPAVHDETKRNEMKREFYLPPCPTLSGSRVCLVPELSESQNLAIPRSAFPSRCEISSFSLSATPPPTVSTNRVKIISTVGFAHPRDRRKASRHRRNLFRTRHWKKWELLIMRDALCWSCAGKNAIISCDS